MTIPSLRDMQSRGRRSYASLQCIWSFFSVLWLGLPATGLAAVTVTLGTVDKQVLVGTIVTPDQVFDGKVVIEGETITCAAVDCEEPEGRAYSKSPRRSSSPASWMPTTTWPTTCSQSGLRPSSINAARNGKRMRPTASLKRPTMS